MGRRRDGRAERAVRAVRGSRGARGAVRQHARRGSTRSSRSPANVTCGRGGSSSATGSTRTRRRTGRPHAKTDADIVASAYLYRSTRLLAEAARVLGRDELADRYAAEAEVVRRAWLDEYVTPAGRIVSDAQTAYALAIMFDLETDPIRLELMGDRLAALVRRDGYRIGTGFVGTPARRRRADPHGARRHGVAAPAPDREPVVAVPGDDGRHDGLGALGQHARGRHHQPRRDDVVQPLRARCDRRLAAPSRRRARPRGARATAGSGSRRSRSAASTTQRPSTRRLTGVPASPGRRTRAADHGDGDGPAEHARRGRPPGTLRDVRGGFGASTAGRSTTRATTDRTAELSLQSSLAAIVDDREAYETVVAVLDAADPEWSRSFRRHTQWVEERA